MATISTTARPAYVYDEVADTWFPVGAQAIAFVQTFEYTATAAQTTFTGVDDNGNTLAYTPIAVRVYLNGALLSPSTDYVAANGTSIVLSAGASVGDILVAIASDTFEVADTYTQAQANLLFVSKSGGSIISQTGSANALTITNTGTGNSFVVEDSASPDATPFVVDADGRVGIGTTSPTERLHISADGPAHILQQRASTNATPPIYYFRKSRGTNESPTVVASADVLGRITWDGYSAAAGSFVTSAYIEAAVDGEPDTAGDTSDMPGRLSFSTTADGAGSPTERLRITSAGNVGIGTTNPANYKLEVAGIVEADNYDIGLTTLASDSIALNFSGETGLYTRTAAGNITFTASNYRVGSIKTVRVIPGASLRNLTFPAGWVFVGIKPASVAANKTGILTVTSFGTTEGDCVAAWAVQT
jgi:hypothetical protein